MSTVNAIPSAGPTSSSGGGGDATQYVRGLGNGPEYDPGPVPDLAGETVGKYRTTGRIGGGSMGVVFAAVDTSLEREAAIKVPKLPPHRAAEGVERLYREAKAAAALSHPSICGVYEVISVGRRPAIVMERVPGRPLDEILREGGPLTPEAAASLGAALADALDVAHDAGVLHRDVKPANVVVRPDGRPVLMDFGLAWRLDGIDESRLTSDGAAVGSPAYMSPEQVTGGTLGPASDIYGLGVTLYEAATGAVPFRGTVTAVAAQVAQAKPAPPRGGNGLLPKPLRAAILKAMAKSPADRYAHAGEFARVLAAAADGRVAPTPADISNRIATRRGRSWLGPAVAATLAAAAGAWWLLRESPVRERPVDEAVAVENSSRTPDPSDETEPPMTQLTRARVHRALMHARPDEPFGTFDADGDGFL